MQDRDEYVAQAFHEAYEKLAPRFGYETREESRVPWSQVPEANRRLMVAVVHELVAAEVIEHGPLTRQQRSALGRPTELEQRLQDSAREV